MEKISLEKCRRCIGTHEPCNSSGEKMNLNQMCNWIKKNWMRIPNEFKEDIRPRKYSNCLTDLDMTEHIVVLLVDRQKPSVIASYSFDEERFGVTRTGKLIWGFDSGCSCPISWDTNYPKCYTVSKSWKEFEVHLREFDIEFETIAYSRFLHIAKTIEEIEEKELEK